MQLRQFIHCAGIAAAVACFNAPFNASAAVESPIVGYQTITSNVGFTMLGCIFTAVDGKPVLIKDLLKGDFRDGDQIQVCNIKGGYTPYQYNTERNGWIDLKTWKPATAPITPGSAFWLKTPGRNVSITIAGAVKIEDYVYTAKQGFQMISPSFPMDFNPNSVKWTNQSDGDQLQVSNVNGGYTPYQYNKARNGWISLKTWALVTAPICPAGASLWLKATSAGVTITIPAVR